MLNLTPRQHALIAYIENFIHTHGYAPSYREIRDHFNLASLGTVYKYIQVLVKKGFLTALKGQKRSLALADPAESTISDSRHLCSLPLIGSLRGGKPVDMFSTPQQVMLPAVVVENSATSYLLRVDDYALREELIAAGDLMLIEVRPPHEEGEVVVGLVNGCEVLVKKYYLAGAYVRLEGQHAQHTPMIILADYIQILGILKKVIRHYGNYSIPSSGSGS